MIRPAEAARPRVGREGAVDFLLSPDHVAALAVTAVLCVALPGAARRRPGAWTEVVSRGLAILLVAWFVAYHVVLVVQDDFSWRADLPLHLTDVVTVVAAVALWTRRPLFFELTFFWGLAASLPAVITPGLDPDEGFPSFYYWHYFITHSGAVLAALFMAFGLGLTARPGAVGRMLAATAAWAAVAAVGNLITGGNYMFLREPPDTASVLDYLGPWPWYILAAAALAAALFWVLDEPFRRRRALAAATTRP
jgi:hypothetical integral membrane protein (TIGR02206 family)